MNSSIEIADAFTILGKLIHRTGEGKLDWQVAGNSYTTTLGPNLRAEIAENSFLDFSLVEFDPSFEADLMARHLKVPDKEVLHVTVEKNPAYGYDSVQEKKLAELLTDMTALARRSALGLNSSMERALTYLDKIAG